MFDFLNIDHFVFLGIAKFVGEFEGNVHFERRQKSTERITVDSKIVIN